MAQQQQQEHQPLREESDDDDDSKKNNPQPEAQDPKPQPVAQSAVNNQQSEKNAKDYANEVGVACNQCYNWFPIGLFGWIGGIVVIACCVIDIFITALTFTQFFVIALLICGGLILICVEMPQSIVKTQRMLKTVQLALYEWLKLLSRMWGRAVYCVVLTVMCFSEISGGFQALPWIAGIYCACLVVLYFIFGLLAAKKYNALHIYISAAHQNKQNVDLEIAENKNDEQKHDVDSAADLTQTFAQKFDELDQDNDGKITKNDIARLALEANLKLSNSECHALFCYFDFECNGDIVKDDWTRMWLKHPRLIWM